MPMPERDESGFLLDHNAWEETIAEQFAKDDGLNLTEDHWEVINFIRDHFRKHNKAPDARLAIKLLKEKGHDRNRLFELFP